MRDWLEDARFWVLLAAVALTLLAIVLPRVTLTRNVYDLVAVVDITGSMNTRDMMLSGKPASRLDATKAALERLLSEPFAARTDDGPALRNALGAANRKLSQWIRSGRADDGNVRDSVHAHLHDVIRRKVAESNPKYLGAKA